MVKGISRRVIVVKSPDPEIFEEAIFVVREEYLQKSSGSVEKIMKEAQRTADDYVRSSVGLKKRGLFSRLLSVF